MKKGIILLVLLAFAWTGFGSWYWTCKVQHDCLDNVVAANIEAPAVVTAPKCDPPKVNYSKPSLPVHLFDKGIKVYFDTNKDNLKDNAYSELQSFANQIKGGDYSGVNVKGHADITGSNIINKALSINRANRVQKYLEYLGVQNCHVVSEGFSSNYPASSNNTAEGRKMNRRVEVQLYK